MSRRLQPCLREGLVRALPCLYKHVRTLFYTDTTLALWQLPTSFLTQKFVF